VRCPFGEIRRAPAAVLPFEGAGRASSLSARISGLPGRTRSDRRAKICPDGVPQRRRRPARGSEYTGTSTMTTTSDLSQVLHRARHCYAERVTGGGADVPWWTAVVVTAGSQQQAERYTDEIGRRREQDALPPGVSYLVVADLENERIGSGGATFNALRAVAEASSFAAPAASLVEWWQSQRVLVIHAGGDSRRSRNGCPRWEAIPGSSSWTATRATARWSQSRSR
jgi:hypothetical protein